MICYVLWGAAGILVTRAPAALLCAQKKAQKKACDSDGMFAITRLVGDEADSFINPQFSDTCFTLYKIPKSDALSITLRSQGG